jgi:hypothetical protein
MANFKYHERVEAAHEDTMKIELPAMRLISQHIFQLKTLGFTKSALAVKELPVQLI